MTSLIISAHSHNKDDVNDNNKNNNDWTAFKQKNETVAKRRTLQIEYERRRDECP